MSRIIFILDKQILRIKKQISEDTCFLSNKLRRDRLWSPAFLDPPFRWRVGDGYFSTSKLVTLFIHLYYLIVKFILDAFVYKESLWISVLMYAPFLKKDVLTPHATAEQASSPACFALMLLMSITIP